MAEIRKETERETDDRLKYLLFKGAPMPDGWKLPPRIDAPPKSDHPAIKRAKQEIDLLKAASFESWERKPFEAGIMASPGPRGEWAKLTEWGKLDTMQHWINWEGVSQQDRASLMLAHLDPEKLPPGAREGITQDAKGHFAPGVPAPEMPEPEM
jgi:hypothetical protein